MYRRTCSIQTGKVFVMAKYWNLIVLILLLILGVGLLIAVPEILTNYFLVFASMLMVGILIGVFLVRKGK